MREFEQTYVVDRFYRPTGYVWKQSVGKDFRIERAAQVRQLSLLGRDINFLVAYYGLIYRLDVFSEQEAKQVSGLLLAEMQGDATGSAKQQGKLIASAFDLLMIQHATEAWAALASNGEFILRTTWAPPHLKELAADMAVQARYQQVKLKVFQNKITPDDIVPISKAAMLASNSLGENRPAIAHYRGLIAAMEGNLKASVIFHTEAGQGGYRTQFFRAGENLTPISVMKAKGDQSAALPTALLWQRRETGLKDCSLIACDGSYFYQYFDGFAESFAIQNPGGLLHIHGAGFVPPIERIEAAETTLGIHIHVSYDEMNMNALSPDMYKGYAAGSRYLILPELLKCYDSIIVHDIDGVLKTDMNSIWDSSKADIQISSLVLDDDRKGHFAFWSNIGAGAFAVRKTDNSIKFVTALSSYLAERFDICHTTGARYFFTDQIGLLLAVLAFEGEVEMARMPQIFSQSDDTRGTGRAMAKKTAQAASLAKIKREKAE